LSPQAGLDPCEFLLGDPPPTVYFTGRELSGSAPFGYEGLTPSLRAASVVESSTMATSSKVHVIFHVLDLIIGDADVPTGDRWR